MTRTVRHERFDYLVADDDPVAHDAKWWAVLRTRAVDELTGEPPLGRLTLSTTTPGCLPRVAGDGLCGLVARPQAVSSQMLKAGAFTAEIVADGYLPRSLTAAIDAARRTTGSAAENDRQLTIAAPEPAPRLQFRPGRGVLLETRTAGEAHAFTLTADRLPAPDPDVVPLTDPVQRARPPIGAPWQVAGVPLVLPDQPLHRAQPAIVRGRALTQAPPGGVLGKVDGAPATRIGVKGVWWTYGEIRATHVPPHDPDFVVFAAPLAFDHAAGTAVERLTGRVPDSTARALTLSFPAGATEIELSDVTGLNLAGGDVLEIEAANSNEHELALTAGYVAPLGGVTRAVVRLAAPLAFPHRAATPVARATLTFSPFEPLPIPPSTLAREAQRGDVVLFASKLKGVKSQDVLRIAGGTPSAELRFVRRLPLHDGAFSHPLTLDGDGSFVFPPIARVAQMQLFVEHVGYPLHPTIDVVPDYRSDTTLQILFKP